MLEKNKNCLQLNVGTLSDLLLIFTLCSLWLKLNGEYIWGKCRCCEFEAHRSKLSKSLLWPPLRMTRDHPSTEILLGCF